MTKTILKNSPTVVIKYDKKTIRTTVINGTRWFACIDVVSVLSTNKDPGNYLQEIRLRSKDLQKKWGTITKLLPLEKSGFGVHLTRCAGQSGIEAIISHMDKAKAEPFKLFLSSLSKT